MDIKTERLKIFVRGAYDFQKLRIEMGNRIVGNFKVKLGQAPSTPEEDMDAEAKTLLKSLRESYQKITDGVTGSKVTGANFVADGVISDYAEYKLIQQYLDFESAETRQFRSMKTLLADFPVYTEFLEGVKGVGPAMAGVITSEIDISKSKYSSSLWKYAGLDVIKYTDDQGEEVSEGRCRKEKHLVEVEYKAKDGSMKKRNSITFNPYLKTKLIGVLGPSFLKCKSPYRDIYDQYKHRLENHAKYKDVSKGHRHNMAIRYMVKRFLVDLYLAWRKLEGLPATDEYAIAKLGYSHG